MIVEEGDIVFLETASESMKPIHLIPKNFKGKINKKSCNYGELIGKTFGDVVELDDSGHFAVVDSELLPSDSSWKDDHPTVLSTNEKPSTDNRGFWDSNTSQKLTHSEIEQLKSQQSGSEIVSTIISHSETFEKRTEFSKQKYLNRKHSKYVCKARILPVSYESVTKCVYDHDESDTAMLRSDILAQLVFRANVHWGQRALIFDDCKGCVVGAAAMKMALGIESLPSKEDPEDPGNVPEFRSFLDSWKDKPVASIDNIIFRVFSGSGVSEKAITLYKPSEACLQHIINIPLPSLPERINFDSSKVNEPIDAHELTWKSALSRNQRMKQFEKDKKRREMEEKGLPIDDELKKDEVPMAYNPVVMEDGTPRGSNYVKLETESKDIVDGWIERGAHCLIVVSLKYNPVSVFQRLFPLLLPGRSFAVYSSSLEPLSWLKYTLKETNQAVNLKLTSTICHKYQMYPGRTHPEMSMDDRGGYILSGCKLYSVSDTPKPEETGTAKKTEGAGIVEDDSIDTLPVQLSKDSNHTALTDTSDNTTLCSTDSHTTCTGEGHLGVEMESDGGDCLNDLHKKRPRSSD